MNRARRSDTTTHNPLRITGPTREGVAALPTGPRDLGRTARDTDALAGIAGVSEVGGAAVDHSEEPASGRASCRVGQQLFDNGTVIRNSQ